MPEPKPIHMLTLDEEEVIRQNEALIIENETLKDQLQDAYDDIKGLSERLIVLLGVNHFGVQTPEEVRPKYAKVEATIDDFVNSMERSLRHDQNHKSRVLQAMKSEGLAKAFRTALRSNPDLQAAATNPLTSVSDIWRAYIWRFLLQKLFSQQATLDFYLQPGENATYYIRNINELDYLMGKATDGQFGSYSRRLWKRQALSAVFRTADHSWLRSARNAKTDELCQLLVRVFKVFARPLGEDGAHQLARKIIAAAVELNEHMMIEADDIWTLDLDQIIGPETDFHSRLSDMDLKSVATVTALRDNSPLDSIRSRLATGVIKQRVEALCVVAPAFRYRHISREGYEYQDPVTLVKPQVLVALNEVSLAVPAQDGAALESPFFVMAQSLGLC
ncbi:hypothetical protein J7T55_005783 [Diaporthe amygdali]|uniref:uncharacterized protein n=1 Tax=Phomopsis amygdali TaxID=1214568 RepID=UPI0022FE885B|nr:uncharacterized protein J7T55_005783 [Diaporthe amygdali]KAJ0124445.1 hypothetical protein J7T55_005783 [Diaporthe amygdali]